MFARWRNAGLLSMTLMAVLGLAILLGLGTWQLNRRAWKEELLATIARRMAAAPIDREAWLKRRCREPAAVGLAASCEFLAVRLTGSFEHARESHVYTIAPRVNGIGGVGYWIMTPFRLAGSQDQIYVSRGFVPLESKAAATRVAGQIEGETVITGLVRSAEPRGTFTGANDPKANIYYLRNPAEFADPAIAAGQAQATFVDLISPTPPGGLPRPTAGSVEIPNRHLEYALTWYGLALTLAGVFVAFASARLRSV